MTSKKKKSFISITFSCLETASEMMLMFYDLCYLYGNTILHLVQIDFQKQN